MWTIAGKPIDPARFRPFEAVDVLYEFDGPRVFTMYDAEGELNLAYWSDENETVYRYVVVPTTEKILDSLRKGSLSVFDALNQPRCWLCDISPNGDISQCQRVDFEAIPRDSLPVPGTMLLPSLGPQLVDLEGRIRELDKDRLSFDLRDIEGRTQTQRFMFDAELLDEVVQAFREDARVRVAGRSFPAKNVAYALTLSRMAERDE
ncbi:MAG: DUF6575 domain-containing protein [Pirellulales bacterium]